MSSHYQKASFLLSVADVKQLPPDIGIEIAMVGRSNAGKSSVLNRITHSKNLARVSKTPGRTQLVNIFKLDDTRRLVDLPGYGFAKAPIAAQRIWLENVNAYFENRASLKGLVLVMDSRHPLKESDMNLLAFAESHQLAVHILLNKADKLSKSVMLNTLRQVKNALGEFSNPVTIQLFSALRGIGIDELHSVLNTWYQYD